MQETTNVLAQLKKMEVAKVIAFNDQEVGLKMMEMGVVPNSKIELVHIAPLGDPIAIRLETGGMLSLRKADAETIVVKVDK